MEIILIQYCEMLWREKNEGKRKVDSSYIFQYNLYKTTRNCEVCMKKRTITGICKRF